MDDERKDALREELRERNHRRGITCRRCGSFSMRRIPGAKLDPTAHFDCFVYEVCSACGYEWPVKHRKGELQK